ncbi:GntP family permease [Angustibacter aerolatus]
MPYAILAADPIEPAAGSGQLILAALVGIAVLVLLITWAKLHPFLALTIGSLVVGAVATQPLADTVASFTKGVGDTTASVGTLIALGAMFGKLLADSGGASQIVDTIVGRASARALPWAMALVGAVIGLPMFFEIGLVLLVPVVLLVARRANQPLMRIAIPTLAGLSAMHGLVPPHPGPLAAIGNLKADLGLTLALGIAVAIPTVIVAGPLFARLAVKWVPVTAPESSYERAEDGEHAGRRPAFGITLFTVLLPVVLMLARAIAEVVAPDAGGLTPVLVFLGTPLVALLIAVLVAIFTLGRGAGMGREALSKTFGDSLPPIAGIILIVAAGGGFKQTLVDTGIGSVLADFIKGSSVSPLLLAWLVAVLIRLGTGSATVATVTASGILQPATVGMPNAEISLLVLAIGAGSVFFSHVNDAGFWLTKEYFGLSVGQNIRTWSLMETVLSVTGLVLVLILGIFV